VSGLTGCLDAALVEFGYYLVTLLAKQTAVILFSLHRAMIMLLAVSLVPFPSLLIPIFAFYAPDIF